ncbi:MAG: DUF3427 domain-containing protein [Parabacteroides sp.]|jgi:superfamily II DNA or RNA helicase/HKD family nuclease|nr:DUF3427 domain-containing protein [Parabacteroides sp.]MBP9580005.1 DUF3427 domain-containing protein [Parabacteroides sp.]
MELTTGIYETLIYKALQDKLINLNPLKYHSFTDSIDEAEAPKLIANYISKILHRILSDDSFESLSQRIEFVNSVFKYVESEWEWDLNEDYLIQQNNLLTGIIDRVGMTDEQVKSLRTSLRPLSGFNVSNLFTGSNSDISIDNEICRDILSADRISWIVAFIRFSGIKIFEESLRKFVERPGAELRVITTTYMAASEPKAIQLLANLPNTKIRVSYNTSIERLHAKSYIFERNSGFSTAYIGSSNISKSALTKGLEWNIRVTNQENPHIIQKALATFDTYWNNPDFEDFTKGGIDKFRKAIEIEYNKKSGEVKDELLQTFHIQNHQKSVLSKLKVEREVHRNFRNLIVAATGTGKTAIAAFDYKNQCKGHPENYRLLFVVHREEILRQALSTFRSILNDANFGELWVGNYTPSKNGNLNHLFISVQTFNSKRQFFQDTLPASYYDYIVIDEAHHSTANSYRDLFAQFTPHIFLGLTATPERMDGESILPDFNNRISAEIRLPEALNLLLLCPFQYYCITDDVVDLRDVDCPGGRYDINQLTQKLCDPRRLQIVVKAVINYVADEFNCKALCFCSSMEHAKFMKEGLCKAGLNAAYLTSLDPKDKRQRVLKELQDGLINYLCVVDLYNEGVDIPEVDTVLFLRPTESLTVFLQQLGRGLRLDAGKEVLTVLDFVSQAHKNYNYESRFRALIGRTVRSVSDEINNEFALLPRGCSIRMEKLAKEYILNNINTSIFDLRRLRREVELFRVNSHLELTLINFLNYFDQDIRIIYANKTLKCWTKLKMLANQLNYTQDAMTTLLEKGMSRLIHVNSINYLSFIKQLIENGFRLNVNSNNAETYAVMFYYDIFQEESGKLGFATIYDAIGQIANYPYFVQELKEIIEYLEDKINHLPKPIELGYPTVLDLHGCYTREQLLVVFGKSTPVKKGNIPREGNLELNDLNTEILWVTLNKSDKDFSPSTQYEDYAINDVLFHWQSKNNTSHSNSGRRFLEQSKTKRKILLFVRENKKDVFGLTSPYYCFGLIDYVDSFGDKPMNITWQLQEPIPPYLLLKAEKMAVG